MTTNPNSRLGAYKSPAELAALFRKLADALETDPLGEDWGGIVNGCYMRHSPHPLWDSAMDASMTVTFRDMAPHIATALCEDGAWMVRDSLER